MPEATRGILLPCCAELPLVTCIANRTLDKAEKLATQFAEYGKVSACGLADLADGNAGKVDWIINASSASLGRGAATNLSQHTESGSSLL